jgi:hypothetical protein
MGADTSCVKAAAYTVFEAWRTDTMEGWPAFWEPSRFYDGVYILTLMVDIYTSTPRPILSRLNTDIADSVTMLWLPSCDNDGIALLRQMLGAFNGTATL